MKGAVSFGMIFHATDTKGGFAAPRWGFSGAEA